MSTLFNFHQNTDLSVDDLSSEIMNLVVRIGEDLSSENRLRFLFAIDNKLYEQIGKAAIDYNYGIHTKHRHIKYHQFFVDRILANSKVLDIGCGNGALTCDIASQVPGVNVIGIDLNSTNIAYANKNFSHTCVKYICGDVLKDLPNENFDYVVMSNVLEHLSERVTFLKTLNERYKPKSFLIRVPVFERDWRVPLKQELHMEYRLDATHYIEYKKGEFEMEIWASGLKIKEQIFNWGEIWAECICQTDS